MAIILQIQIAMTQKSYTSPSPRHSPTKRTLNLCQKSCNQSSFLLERSILGKHMTSSQFMTALAEFRKGESPNFSPTNNRPHRASPHLSPKKKPVSPGSPLLHQTLSAHEPTNHSRLSPTFPPDSRTTAKNSIVESAKRRLLPSHKPSPEKYKQDTSTDSLKKKVTFEGERRLEYEEDSWLTPRSHNMSVTGSLMQLREPSYPLKKPHLPQPTSILRSSPSHSPKLPRLKHHPHSSQTPSSSNSPFMKNSQAHLQSSSFESTNSSNRASDLMSERSKYNKGLGQISDFMLGMEIGSGQFGKVYVAKHIGTGFVCAIKKIEKRVIVEKNIVGQMIREIKIQSCLDHPNIAKLYGVLHDQFYVYLIMELATSGQLYKMVKEKRKFTEQTIAYIVKQICEAVRYLHTFKIIHRDIKPENIVMQHGVVKLCDFGWAVCRGQSLRSTFCGTPFYVSPEVLKGEMYSQKIDIWSVGVLTYELLVGDIPFRIRSEDELVNIIRDQIKFPEQTTASQQAQDFVMKFLQKNPQDRYKISQLLEHPFLKQCKDITLAIQF